MLETFQNISDRGRSRMVDGAREHGNSEQRYRKRLARYRTTVVDTTQMRQLRECLLSRCSLKIVRPKNLRLFIRFHSVFCSTELHRYILNSALRTSHHIEHTQNCLIIYLLNFSLIVLYIAGVEFQKYCARKLWNLLWILCKIFLRNIQKQITLILLYINKYNWMLYN